MKNKQKGFIIPLIVVIVALLVVGGGIYIYIDKKNEVPNTPNDVSSQSNQTAPVETVSGNTTNNYIQTSNNKFHSDSGVTYSGMALTYQKDNFNFGINIMKLKDKNSADVEMVKLVKTHNPSKIIFGGQEINFTEQASNFYLYFYQSENSIYLISTGSPKNEADNFVLWFLNNYR